VLSLRSVENACDRDSDEVAARPAANAREPLHPGLQRAPCCHRFEEAGSSPDAGDNRRQPPARDATRLSVGGTRGDRTKGDPPRVGSRSLQAALPASSWPSAWSAQAMALKTPAGAISRPSPDDQREVAFGVSATCERQLS
jgi:hypothetical protein